MDSLFVVPMYTEKLEKLTKATYWVNYCQYADCAAGHVAKYSEIEQMLSAEYNAALNGCLKSEAHIEFQNEEDMIRFLLRFS